MRMDKQDGVPRDSVIEAWFTRYGDIVLRNCYVLLRDAQLAQDAMQETFFKAWQSLDRFENREGGSEKSWLMRIAANICKDYLRGGWFKHMDRSVTPDTLPPPLLAIEDEDRTLFLSVMELPLKYRQVILMYHYNGLTLRETAEALRVNVSSARYRLKKAEALLKTALEGEI